MRKIIAISILLISTSFMSFAQESIHQFTLTAIDGSEFSFADLKGKKIMIVNTASKCGLTPQYELLEALYKEYQDKDFVIVGFPANNFLWQEPGTDEEIKEFCTKNYGVSFPMMSKISVKGNDIHPIYSWLTQKSKNGVMDSKIKWNFQKYLIDENGKLVDVLSPKEKPNCEKVILWLQE
ncbi:MAG: glutathione peroxidase [Marinifilaceae bacterium]|nr:glutathione peroxidase [Labilibaculum sp.]MBN2598241.1 glutathione peroxidase [Marinifilaceae bacterium]